MTATRQDQILLAAVAFKTVDTSRHTIDYSIESTNPPLKRKRRGTAWSHGRVSSPSSSAPDRRKALAIGTYLRRIWQSANAAFRSLWWKIGGTRRAYVMWTHTNVLIGLQRLTCTAQFWLFSASSSRPRGRPLRCLFETCVQLDGWSRQWCCALVVQDSKLPRKDARAACISWFLTVSKQSIVATKSTVIVSGRSVSYHT
jgi:hypothetical protein